MEDIDPEIYEKMEDEHIPLTPEGIQQAHHLSHDLLLSLETGSKIDILLAPSKRVCQTGNILSSKLAQRYEINSRVEEGLRKQNRGDLNLTNRDFIDRQRYETGVLRYHYPGGESGPNFVQRYGAIAARIIEDLIRGDSQATIVITHGFEVRVLLMSLLNWSENYFEDLAYPHNCEYKRVAVDQNGELRLLDEMRLHDLHNKPGYIRRKTRTVP